MSMPAGILRHPIIIERLKTEAEGLVVTSSGHIDQTLASNWTDHALRRAEIRELSGREFQQDDQVNADTTHQVTVRFDPETRTILPTYRVKTTTSLT